MCQTAYENNIPKMKMQLKKGYNINTGDYDARTALHLAASEGHLEMC